MPLRNTALHMAVAFLAMGAWATFANSDHPLPRALTAGLVQGAMSALITLFLKRMIEALSRRLPGTAGLILPPLAAVASSLVLLVSIHSLAATPEIARTIAVPLGVTTLYSASYSYALWRPRHG